MVDMVYTCRIGTHKVDVVDVYEEVWPPAACQRSVLLVLNFLPLQSRRSSQIYISDPLLRQDGWGGIPAGCAGTFSMRWYIASCD